MLEQCKQIINIKRWFASLEIKSLPIMTRRYFKAMELAKFKEITFDFGEDYGGRHPYKAQVTMKSC